MSTNNTNRKIEIFKAELKNDLFIKASYYETIGKDTDQVTRDCSAPAHDDLRKLFRQLIPHLALITEQVRFDDVNGRRASKETPEENPDADQRENLMDPDGLFMFSDADWKIVTAMRYGVHCKSIGNYTSRREGGDVSKGRIFRRKGKKNAIYNTPAKSDLCQLR